MLKPRYGVQDWVCMVVPFPVRRAVCETILQLTPFLGKVSERSEAIFSTVRHRPTRIYEHGRQESQRDVVQARIPIAQLGADRHRAFQHALVTCSGR